MNDSNQAGFLIPVLSAVPLLFVACSDSDDPIETDLDAGSAGDTTGADGTIGEDTTEPDVLDDTTEPDAVEDVVEADGSAQGDVAETDGSAQGDVTTDVVDDTATDAAEDTTTDADAVTDATTDTADGTIEPDTDTGGELTAYEEFLAGIDDTALATYCGEVVDCGYEPTVEECAAFAPTLLDDIIEYAYEVTPDGLRDGCVDAAIALANCRLESSYCDEYYGYYGYYTYLVSGSYFCGDEFDAVEEVCLAPFAGTCDDDTIRLEFAQLCDGASDCVDGFDESACSLCEDGTTLYRDELACDGNLDCVARTGDSTDLGDETGCEPATIFECANGDGIDIELVCDGDNDCSDGSDEVGCPVFTCADGVTEILESRLCNGSLDCANESGDSTDLSDEAACEPATIFICADGVTTIRPSWVCDGDLDCASRTGDGTDLSDEIDCDPATIFACADGTGADIGDVCDGFNDCADGSDEVDCPVFTCADGTTEILAGLVCDGTADCANESADSADFSDEVGCPVPTLFVCADGLDATRYTFVCDGDPDCTDGSDELDCPEDFVCLDGSDTIPPNWVCDREDDCADASDEVDCPPDFECLDGSDIIPPGWVCDFDLDCADGSDEVGCLD